MISRAEKLAHPQLDRAAALLRAGLLRSAESVFCHGDLLTTNVFLEDGALTGVLDWTRACIAHPAYDVAGTLARITTPLPPLSRMLSALLPRVQRVAANRYLAAYRRHVPLDAVALRYFEVFWLLHELVWGLERNALGLRYAGRVEERWLSSSVQADGLARLQARLGDAGA